MEMKRERGLREGRLRTCGCIRLRRPSGVKKEGRGSLLNRKLRRTFNQPVAQEQIHTHTHLQVDLKAHKITSHFIKYTSVVLGLI